MHEAESLRFNCPNSEFALAKYGNQSAHFRATCSSHGIGRFTTTPTSLSGAANGNLNEPNEVCISGSAGGAGGAVGSELRCRLQHGMKFMKSRRMPRWQRAEASASGPRTVAVIGQFSPFRTQNFPFRFLRFPRFLRFSFSRFEPFEPFARRRSGWLGVCQAPGRAGRLCDGLRHREARPRRQSLLAAVAGP